MELNELQREFDRLTQQTYQDTAIMRGIAADLTAQAYMLEAVHQMLDAIEPRRNQLAQRIQASLLPAPQQAPQIHGNPEDDFPAFVRRVDEQVRDYEPQSDLARVIQGIRNRAAE